MTCLWRIIKTKRWKPTYGTKLLEKCEWVATMFQVHSHFLRVIPEIGWYDLGYDSNFDRSAKSTATVWFALFCGRFVAKSLVRHRNEQATAICSCKLALSPVTVLASPKVNAIWNVSERYSWFGRINFYFKLYLPWPRQFVFLFVLQ